MPLEIFTKSAGQTWQGGGTATTNIPAPSPSSPKSTTSAVKKPTTQPAKPKPVTKPTTGVEAKRQALVDFMKKYVKKCNYTNTNPDRLYPWRYKDHRTDCSGMVRWAYKEVCGIKLGTYTGDQYYLGKTVLTGKKGGHKKPDISKMKKGDLIFIMWYGNTPKYNHVEMYCGNNRALSHGGPKWSDIGPTWKGPEDKRMAGAYYYRVQRLID